jgi:hypothetical protein
MLFLSLSVNQGFKVFRLFDDRVYSSSLQPKRLQPSSLLFKPAAFQ